MTPISISLLTICGLEELAHYGSHGVTHVLSILDPHHPEPDAFLDYGAHDRTVLRFHDAIEPAPGVTLPTRAHVEAVLDFGRSLAQTAHRAQGHLLVHCHAGISRSTAAMLTLLAQIYPDQSEAALFDRVSNLRPKAWPNSRMVEFADELLGRDGALSDALARHYARQLLAYPHIREFMMANGRAREVAMAESAARVSAA